MSKKLQKHGVYDVIQFVDIEWGEKFNNSQLTGENMDTCKINLNSKPPTLNFMDTKFTGTVLDLPQTSSSSSSSSSKSNNKKSDKLSNVILSEKCNEKIKIIGQTNRIIEFHIDK